VEAGALGHVTTVDLASTKKVSQLQLSQSADVGEKARLETAV
jgi:hypothetical protein